MKKFVLYLCIMSIVASCYTSEKPKKPENLIAKDKMINIIIDMSLLSSAKGVNKRALENNGVYPLEYVYKKHNIDSLQFAQSNAYYTYNVKEYESIYNTVKDSLDTLKDKYNAIEEIENKEKRKRDSIRKAEKKDSINQKKKNISKKLG